MELPSRPAVVDLLAPRQPVERGADEVRTGIATVDITTVDSDGQKEEAIFDYRMHTREEFRLIVTAPYDELGKVRFKVTKFETKQPHRRKTEAQKNAPIKTMAELDHGLIQSFLEVYFPDGTPQIVRMKPATYTIELELSDPTKPEQRHIYKFRLLAFDVYSKPTKDAWQLLERHFPAIKEPLFTLAKEPEPNDDDAYVIMTKKLGKLRFTNILAEWKDDLAKWEEGPGEEDTGKLSKREKIKEKKKQKRLSKMVERERLREQSDDMDLAGLPNSDDFLESIERLEQAANESEGPGEEHPEDIDYDVAEIAGMRVVEGRLMYRVVWEGCDEHGRPWPESWEPKEKVNAPEKIAEFHEKARQLEQEDEGAEQ
ncbi:MAG: hypothetical protein Q9227_008940 [Pyrenula ochraceoflavens]